ncbi:uncharacterized protein LOC143808400 [Ranitomeya variabilis]|uniref:uncharacterized protein LOC143808400 n=1 Tax=Ranitomeya variabilis TaxID=490064 RepID=UPI004055D6B4
MEDTARPEGTDQLQGHAEPSIPTAERKKSGKNKCPICSTKFPENWRKPLCKSCTSKIVGDEQTALLSSMRTMIRQEVQASISSLNLPQATQSEPQTSRKRLRESSPSSEGEVSGDSDQEERDGSVGRGKRYLFAATDTDELLYAVRNTMQLQDTPEETSIQDEMFGGLHAQVTKVFPVNNHIRSMILEEWQEAEKKLVIPRDFRLRLPYNPEDIKVWDEVPKIDVPLAKVAKKTSIPFEDSSALKDPMDRKADGLLRRTWESSAAIIRANIAATSVARSMHLWIDDLEDHLKAKTSREVILKSLPLLKLATGFMADASAESVRFAARSESLSNAARRAIWLKTWSGDLQSKNKLCGIPFSGNKVFGPILDDILEKASDKKKGFPEENTKKYQPFRRSRPGQRTNYKGKGKTGRWSYPKGGKGRDSIFPSAGTPKSNK